MRRTVIFFGCSLVACGALAGCVDDRGDSGDDGIGTGLFDDGGDDGYDDDGGDGGDKFDVPGGDGDGDGDASQCACAPKSDLIYVLSYEQLGPGSIWTFDPNNYQFSKVADLGNCGIGDLPFSMGVSRDGRAFVQLIPSGDIVTVDVNTGECGDPGFSPGQAAGLGNFGMAFVSRSADDPCDKLYGIKGAWDQSPYSCPGQGCGRLGVASPHNLSFTMVGDVDYFGGELSGTGDGRLFAFVHDSPSRLVELDKETGEELESLSLTGVSTTDAFAFAFWGGDFYLFTEANDTLPSYPEAPSKVVRVDWDESDGQGKKIETIIGAAPILVAGAGVSTCAPYVPQG
jgi:hypothetical protein